MKVLKIVGIGIGVVIALLAAGLAYVASQFDAARLKSELARVVLEEKQRTLKIDGELELSFWPNLGVKLGRLSLSEHASPQAFAAVDSARVAVAVMPLLQQRMVVEAVDIRGLTATVVRRQDGTLNIDDLLSKEKSTQPTRLDIAAIKVADAQLTWRDEKAGSSTTVSGLDLDTGKVQVDTGRGHFEAHAVKLAAQGQLDAERFELALDAPRLMLTPQGAGGDDLKLAVKLSGPQRQIDAKLGFAGVTGEAHMLKVAKFSLQLDARSGATSVQAMLESPLTAEFDAAQKRQRVVLAKLVGSAEIAHPQMPMKLLKLPINGGLSADLAQQSAQLALTTQFDESKIALSVDVNKFAPLALAFALDIDRLNVDKYLPPKPPGAPAQAADQPLDFSALKGLDVKGSVKIGSLQIAKVQAANVRLQIKAANGRFDIAPHSANLYDGTLNGSLSLDANGNRVTLKQNLAGVNINPLMQDAVDKDLVEGRGNLALDLTTHGTSVTAMKKALAGSASVALKDGALKGINLAQSFRQLKAKFSSKQDAVQQARQTDKTDFSELSASFKIANGVAHNEDLAAKSPFLRLAGRGDIDIGNGRLDYLARASVVATSGGQGAQELEYLKGLTVPVRASGPFEQLAYKIEFGDLASAAVKAKVEEKKQELKEKATEKLLRGIFGK